MADITETEKRKAIAVAYELLSDDDKLQIDLQVKRILDYIEQLNFDRRKRNVAIIQMSRAGALEILYAVGAFMGARSIIDN